VGGSASHAPTPISMSHRLLPVAIAAALACLPAAPAAPVTMAGAPIIGVVTDPTEGNSTATGPGWVGVSMAKWLEAGGAQVVPVPFNMPRDELDRLFEGINGIVFQGGDFDPFSAAGQ
jgi:hypothetical protein